MVVSLQGKRLGVRLGIVVVRDRMHTALNAYELAASRGPGFARNHHHTCCRTLKLCKLYSNSGLSLSRGLDAV